MKPIKNTCCTIQYRGICSGSIYTLIHYLPCMATELKATCEENPCPGCKALVVFQSRDREYQAIFSTEGIKNWRIKEE